MRALLTMERLLGAGCAHLRSTDHKMKLDQVQLPKGWQWAEGKTERHCEVEKHAHEKSPVYLED